MGSQIACLTNPDPICTKNASPININVNNNVNTNNINNNDNNQNYDVNSEGTFASVSRIQMQLTTNDILTVADLKTFRESHIQHKQEQEEEQTINNHINNDIEQEIDDGYYDEEERIFEHITSFDTISEQNYIATQRMEWKKGDMLGRGAYGTVYMGLNQTSGKLMAVKQVQVVPNNGIVKNSNGVQKADQYVQSLESEIAVLSNLSHKNIVKYIGTQRDEYNLYIFLEYISGGSISQLLQTFGSFDENVTRIYTRHILEGLQYLHSHRIVHRDIKGGNILIDNNGIPKLADFGAAKKLADVSDNTSYPKSIHGTPYWMAPEVIKQTGHGRYADIWSLGCTVIEMLTGKPPWHQFKTQASALFHIASTSKPPQLPSNLSPAAKSFILCCLQRCPKQRPNSYKLLKHPFVSDVITSNNVSLTMLSPSKQPSQNYEIVNTIESIAIHNDDHSSESSQQIQIIQDSISHIPLLEQKEEQTIETNININEEDINESRLNIKLRSKPSEADRNVINKYLREQYKKKRDHLTGDFKDSLIRGHTPDKNRQISITQKQEVAIESVFRSMNKVKPQIISQTDLPINQRQND
eukprot:94995_1